MLLLLEVVTGLRSRSVPVRVPYCLVGDRVAVASSAESDSLALPVGVGSVGLAVPTD